LSLAMKPRSEPLQTVERLQDLGTAKWYVFNQLTGESRRCNERGDAIAKFYDGVSGMVTTEERKARNLLPKVKAVDPELPYLQLPQKYAGYAQVPRPGLNMSAKADCAYLLPKHLYPPKPKVGRVSTRTQAVSKMRETWPEGKPTFVDTLGSNFNDTLSLKRFNTEQMTIQTKVDLEAKTARNRQKAEDDGSERLAQLREQRTVTKGRFFATKPPYNPAEIRDKEELRDRKVNPQKWAKADADLLADKQMVDKRRRDRYIMYFVEKEAQQNQLREMQQAANDAAPMVGSGNSATEQAD